MKKQELAMALWIAHEDGRSHKIGNLELPPCALPVIARALNKGSRLGEEFFLAHLDDCEATGIPHDVRVTMIAVPAFAPKAQPAV